MPRGWDRDSEPDQAANPLDQLHENQEGKAGASEGSRRVRSTRPSRIRWTCLKCRLVNRTLGRAFTAESGKEYGPSA
jgi:hypothetical protein